MARWELLGNNCGVYVTGEHSFTTDTLLLADFASPRTADICCADFGTGCGVIPLLWKSRGAVGRVLAVELQKDAAELAARSVRENGLEQEIRVIQGDVRQYREILPHQSLHLIACNPPYYPPDSGAVGNGSRRTSRHGENLTLEDLAAAAKYSLRWGGRLCVCLPSERLAETLSLLRQSGLEPKRLRLVQSGPEKAPYLFLLECKKGGKTGLQAEPVLLLTDNAELERIYGEYRNGAGGKE